MLNGKFVTTGLFNIELSEAAAACAVSDTLKLMRGGAVFSVRHIKFISDSVLEVKLI